MTFTGMLFPYQQEAVDKMIARQQVLVAYDLGLGKTVLTIAALEHLRSKGEYTQPVIVVCLSSLKYQWCKEINKFSDSSALVIDGNRRQRDVQYDEFEKNPSDYLIVNYEQVVNDWKYLSQCEFGALVMDEATAIKSFRSKRTKRVKELSKHIPIRFGLTGTPIENGKPEELFSILQSIDPDLLGRFDLFDNTFIVRNAFGGVDRYRNLPTLASRLGEATVRKSQTDPDVAPFLPDTIHRDPIMVPLDRNAARIYRMIATQLQDDLADAQGLFTKSFNVEAHYGHGSLFHGGADSEMGQIMSKVTALKMLCDDPELIAASAAKYDPYVANQGSKYLYDLLGDESVVAILKKSKNTKLEVLKVVVSDHLNADDNKLVIFCSYIDLAQTIQQAVGGVVYTGQMSAKDKEAAKVRFQTEPSVRILVSTDAGGYGVDLPEANLLINYDLPWSAGLATQRNGRIRRASSKWPSIVIQDILSSDTIEERQHALLHQKNAVASAIIDGEGINEAGGVDLTVGALVQFLKETQP